MKPEQRNFEIRLAEDPDRNGPGILEGVLMPYGERAKSLPERFESGSLHWPDHGVVLREQHNRTAPITRFKPIIEGNEVRVRIPLPDTQRGRDAATLVRNGTFRGLSVEFIAEQESYSGELRSISKAALHGAGLVDDPAYAGAGVSVREQPKPKPRRYFL